MNENIKRIMKICAVGGILHYGMNFFYDLGEGRMLGAIAKENSEIMEALQTLSEYKPDHLSKRLKIGLVTSVALYTAKKEEKP